MIVEWDLPARCEGAFVMNTIMPFTFGRQPIGLLESRQRSSLKIISKLFCVGLISNFSKGSKPRSASSFSHIDFDSFYMNKKPALAHRGRLLVNLYSLPTGGCLWSLWSTETFCERFGRGLAKILCQPCRSPLSCSEHGGSHSHVHRCGTSQRAGWASRQSHQTQTCATLSWSSFG